jgi:hypothetical protein
MRVTDPTETGAEAVVVERHEHLAASSESVEDACLFLGAFTFDPQ